MMQYSTSQKTILKIVIDTNLFLSVFLFRSKMVRTVFELVLDDRLILLVSSELRNEVVKKLDYFKAPKELIIEILTIIDVKGIILDPKFTIQESRDPKDNFLLELSEMGLADYLITSDKDLLDLKSTSLTITEIISPENFLPKLREMKII